MKYLSPIESENLHAAMDLREGDLHTWRYALNETEYHTEKINPLLSEQERERCGEYLHEAEKIRYTCNHRFVRRVLAKYLNIPAARIEFSQAAMGKPFIKNSNLSFSYSYRTTFGLLAVSRQDEVGVDIERIKMLQDLPTFAAFSFSEKEREILYQSDEKTLQDTLFTFWTFKEAVIKALGVGLNANLTQIDLSAFFFTELNPLDFAGNAPYTVKRIHAHAGYKAAIAIRGKLNRYTEFNDVGN